MKPVVFLLNFERSTKNTHRFSEPEPRNGEKPMVLYIQKRDMPDAPAQVRVEVSAV